MMTLDEFASYINAKNSGISDGTVARHWDRIQYREHIVEPPRVDSSPREQKSNTRLSSRAQLMLRRRKLG